MKKKFLLLIIVILTTIISSCKTNISAKAWFTPEEYRNLLGCGLDVDWSKTSEGKESYSKKVAKDLYERGFRHVRIRIKDEADENLFSTLDEQINDCLSIGLIPIIAYQADNFKNSASEDDMNNTVIWWKNVAKHYKKISPLVSYDLIIEVTDTLNKNQEMLNKFYESAVHEIRIINQKRLIFISPRIRSSPEYLSELIIPKTANGYLMAEWHFYASGPSKTGTTKLWTIGTNEEKKIIKDKINYAIKFEKETSILTWVGAWMPGNYNDGNDYSIDEQVVFANFVVSELTNAKIPYSVNSDSHFYNRENGEWITEMTPVVNAILGK